MGYKLLDHNGDGYEVKVASPFVIDDDPEIRIPEAVFFMDANIRTKQRAREILSGMDLKVTTIVSHEPIIMDEHKRLMDRGISFEDIYSKQRLIQGPEWYIDDFGCYVYCHSFVAEQELLRDLRYE